MINQTPLLSLSNAQPVRRARKIAVVNAAVPLSAASVEIQTRIDREGCVCVRVDAARLATRAFGEPDQLEYWLEVMHEHGSEAADLGPVADFCSPSEWIQFPSLARDQQLSFRFTVMRSADYRIVAVCDGVRVVADSQGERDSGSLVTLRSDALDQDIWKLQIDRGNGLVLLVNESIPDLRERLLDDPVFSAAIHEAAIKQFLAAIILDPDLVAPEIFGVWMDLIAERGYPDPARVSALLAQSQDVQALLDTVDRMTSCLVAPGRAVTRAPITSLRRARKRAA